jgi:hypothetical protein
MRMTACPLTDPDIERVITAIAEQCEAGKIGAAYLTIEGQQI